MQKEAPWQALISAVSALAVDASVFTEAATTDRDGNEKLVEVLATFTRRVPAVGVVQRALLQLHTAAVTYTKKGPWACFVA